jgi:outer membrane protein OmpA-like peptidoglycan-associated protein
MKFPTTRAALLPLALSTSAFLHASAADAQVLSRFSLRAEFGAGVMTPTVQRSTLGYDGAHFQATGRIGFDVLDWLSLQLSVNNGFFLASNQLPTGRVLAVQFGLRLQPAIGTVGRLWADVNPGYYSTGSDRRLGLDAGLGFEFNLGRAVALGPVARVHWLPADRATQQPSDAFYLSFGLSLTLRVPHEVAAVVLDRDHDGVLDPVDRCPDQAGMPRPGTDRHGCPGEVIVTPGQIRITNPVFFATNDDVILPQSFPVLTAVRDVLQAVPGIHRVSIEGHTDDVGDDASNLALSNRRAASVMRWLVQNGIEAGRLETHGFGETRPLRPISGLRGRRLREAQAINRRVEFRITDPAPPPEAQGSAPAQTPEQAPRRRHHRHS